MNESAFPYAYFDKQLNQTRTMYGMNLRDYFAARAMASAIPYWKLEDEPLSISFDEIAKDSYDIADAMLKYREKA